MEQFYVTSPSNALMCIYDNTMLSYTTKLYTPLKFYYQYEVALIEKTYPSIDFNTIGKITLKRFEPDETEVSIDVVSVSHNFLEYIKYCLDILAIKMKISHIIQIPITFKNGRFKLNIPTGFG